MEEFIKEYDGLVGAMTATITTILIFFGKEWLDGRRDKQAVSQQLLDVFKIYGDPLALAGKSLVDRLLEIFQTDAQYFRAKKRKSERDQYHYVSTMYRLSSVLAWIRAASREQASLSVADRKFTQDIDQAIKAFQSALADSRVNPGKRLAYFAEKWELDLTELPEGEAEYIEEEIDTIIWEFLEGKPKKHLFSMPKEDQRLLLRKVADHLTNRAKLESVAEEMLGKHHSKLVRTLARTEAWLYRDWQNAIGDILIRESTSESAVRRLEVIGYLEFEKMYSAHDADASTYRWLERVERLFFDLNLKSNANIDARADQLRRACQALIQLVLALEDADASSDLLNQDERSKLETFLGEEEN